MVKEQWWPFLKILVQRYEASDASPAIAAVLSIAFPKNATISRVVPELVTAASALKDEALEGRSRELLAELGGDARFLQELFALLGSRFDGLISSLCQVHRMGLTEEMLAQVAQKNIAESADDPLVEAFRAFQSRIGPQLKRFDELDGALTEQEVVAPPRRAASPPAPRAAQSADDDLMHGPRSPAAERALREEPSAPPEEPAEGDVIGGQDWVLMSLLGKGGMGSVWKAKNHFDELGALKLMLPHLVSNDRLIKRFQLEIRAIKKIRHPNVVEMSDWGKDRLHGREQWYFVTDFIEGKPLSKILQERGGLPMEEAKKMFLQLADGLHAAHAEGVIHRDIKPGNIMVRPDGTPVIIDFGIARQLEDPSMTQTHERVLTLQFASPEQLYGEGVGPQSDVFSLAATLSFVLYPDPKRQRPQFEPDKSPEAFHWLLERCLSYKPETRPQDMREFSEMLSQIEFSDGVPVSFPRRPAPAVTPSSVGVTPELAFTPGGAPAPAAPPAVDIYHYNGPEGVQEKLSLAAVVERIHGAPKGRHLLWKKGWESWQMWHKVEAVRESVRESLMALKESQTQQASAVTPFSKHILSVGGCEHTMIAIPPGSFWMGNQNVDAESDEKPRHRVQLTRGFLLGQTQMTQDIYEIVSGHNPSQYKYPNHPAERVSWYDVVRWCNQLSERQGLRPAYELTDVDGKPQARWVLESDGYRLPTEAEWEYAARAATNLTYAGSNRPDEVAWFGASRRREGQKTYRVGEKEPNGWGFYDMSGNVWEWCWEDMRGYTAADAVDPVGTVETQYRVCRGGSNYLDARQTRCSYRMRYDVNYRSLFVGFRVARTLL